MRDQAHAMTENELKGYVLATARANGWLQHNDGQRRNGNAGDHGFPDLVLARDGEVLFLELKQQNGKLSQDQVDWSMALPSNSGPVHYEVIRPSDLARGRVDELLA